MKEFNKKEFIESTKKYYIFVGFIISIMLISIIHYLFNPTNKNADIMLFTGIFCFVLEMSIYQGRIVDWIRYTHYDLKKMKEK